MKILSLDFNSHIYYCGWHSFASAIIAIVQCMISTLGGVKYITGSDNSDS